MYSALPMMISSDVRDMWCLRLRPLPAANLWFICSFGVGVDDFDNLGLEPLFQMSTGTLKKRHAVDDVDG